MTSRKVCHQESEYKGLKITVVAKGGVVERSSEERLQEDDVAGAGAGEVVHCCTLSFCYQYRDPLVGQLTSGAGAGAGEGAGGMRAKSELGRLQVRKNNPYLSFNFNALFTRINIELGRPRFQLLLIQSPLQQGKDC